MKQLKYYIVVVVLFCFICPSSIFAATVSCEVAEVSGSTIVLKNCDEKRTKDFKKGNKVKVKINKEGN